MISRLRRDADRFPWLFQWNDQVSRPRLEAWLSRQQRPVLPDLADLWAWAGGGDIFETESIIPPVSDAPEIPDVEAVTRRYRDRGLPSDLLVFHEGYVASAFGSTGKITVFDPVTLDTVGEYDNLDEWYLRVIRDEYAERYGLPRDDT